MKEKESIHKNANEKIFQAVAGLATSFGSCARLKIIYLLAQAPRSVENIAEITGESIANTSQHLKRLLHERIVCVKKEKLSRIYSLSDERVALFVEKLFDLAECLSHDYMSAEKELAPDEIENHDNFEAIVNAVKNKKAVLIDLRDEYESTQSPVEGAVSIPITKLKHEAKNFAKSKTYFLFCRGRACCQGSEGVNILRALGFKAYWLKEGPVVLRQNLKR